MLAVRFDLPVYELALESSHTAACTRPGSLPSQSAALLAGEVIDACRGAPIGPAGQVLSVGPEAPRLPQGAPMSPWSEECLPGKAQI